MVEWRKDLNNILNHLAANKEPPADNKQAAAGNNIVAAAFVDIVAAGIAVADTAVDKVVADISAAGCNKLERFLKLQNLPRWLHKKQQTTANKLVENFGTAFF